MLQMRFEAAINAPSMAARAADSLERRRSSVHGLGVFTLKAIPKNTRIIDYAGEKISHQESLRRERRYMKRGQIWCFQTITLQTARGASVAAAAPIVSACCDPERPLPARLRFVPEALCLLPAACSFAPAARGR